MSRSMLKSDINGNRREAGYVELSQRSPWSRALTEIVTRDGVVLDPDDDAFMMNVCREVDRSLLRLVKDAPLPRHIINYRDSNGLVGVGCLCSAFPICLDFHFVSSSLKRSLD